MTAKHAGKWAAVSASFAYSLIGVFATAWYLMLGAGVTRHEWLPHLPALGYWHAWPIALMLNFILDNGSLRARKDNAAFDKIEGKS